jgi:hypothetical protein
MILGWFQFFLNSFIYVIDDSGDRLTPKKTNSPKPNRPICQFKHAYKVGEIEISKFQTHPINGFFSLVF